jgi:hypothetical protein
MPTFGSPKCGSVLSRKSFGGMKSASKIAPGWLHLTYEFSQS